MFVPMKVAATCYAAAYVLLAGVRVRGDSDAQGDASAVGSPIEKILKMISSLQANIIREGSEAQRVYEEFSEWCEEQSKNLGFEMETSKAEIEDLKAVIDDEVALIGSLTTKVEELSSTLAQDEGDLKEATGIREKEAKDFKVSEKDMMDTVDTLQRAIGILEKEIKSGAASMLQISSVKSVVQALSTLVEASALNTADSARLTAFLQAQNSDDDSDGDDDLNAGAPDAAAYESQSAGIIDTLGELLDKAESQVDEARKKEAKAQNNYEMLKQSLETQIKFANQQMDQAKKRMAGSEERKATAEGELDVTTKDLKSSTVALGDVHHDCMTKARDFEAETKSRDEEVKALTNAKQVIKESTGDGGSLVQVSFMQVAASRSDGGRFKVVRMVRDLARNHKAPELAQLAARMASAIRASARGRGGGDPFAKVKGLINDMIGKLEDESHDDATHEQYCQKEMAEASIKQEDKTAEVEKLDTAIESMSAKSAKLKEEIAELQKALADLAKSQSEMDKLRSDENRDYKVNKMEVVKGLEGVKTALKVLRDYYGQDDKAHSSGDGAAGGIISLLEVVESDFTKGLAELEAAEEAAKKEYNVLTKENELDTTSKMQDVKYKTKESIDLDKASSESSADVSNVQTELAAVKQFLTQLKEECVGKAEPYAERKARRDAELAGLKQALDTLSGEAVLLQVQTSHRHLRHVTPHDQENA